MASKDGDQSAKLGDANGNAKELLELRRKLEGDGKGKKDVYAELAKNPEKLASILDILDGVGEGGKDGQKKGQIDAWIEREKLDRAEIFQKIGALKRKYPSDVPKILRIANRVAEIACEGGEVFAYLHGEDLTWEKAEEMAQAIHLPKGENDSALWRGVDVAVGAVAKDIKKKKFITTVEIDRAIDYIFTKHPAKFGSGENAVSKDEMSGMVDDVINFQDKKPDTKNPVEIGKIADEIRRVSPKIGVLLEERMRIIKEGEKTEGGGAIIEEELSKVKKIVREVKTVADISELEQKTKEIAVGLDELKTRYKNESGKDLPEQVEIFINNVRLMLHLMGTSWKDINFLNKRLLEADSLVGKIRGGSSEIFNSDKMAVLRTKLNSVDNFVNNPENIVSRYISRFTDLIATLDFSNIKKCNDELGDFNSEVVLWRRELAKFIRESEHDVFSLGRIEKEVSEIEKKDEDPLSKIMKDMSDVYVSYVADNYFEKFAGGLVNIMAEIKGIESIEFDNSDEKRNKEYLLDFAEKLLTATELLQVGMEKFQLCSELNVQCKSLFEKIKGQTIIEIEADGVKEIENEIGEMSKFLAGNNQEIVFGLFSEIFEGIDFNNIRERTESLTSEIGEIKGWSGRLDALAVQEEKLLNKLKVIGEAIDPDLMAPDLDGGGSGVAAGSEEFVGPPVPPSDLDGATVGGGDGVEDSFVGPPAPNVAGADLGNETKGDDKKKAEKKAKTPEELKSDAIDKIKTGFGLSEETLARGGLEALEPAKVLLILDNLQQAKAMQARMEAESKYQEEMAGKGDMGKLWSSQFKRWKTRASTAEAIKKDGLEDGEAIFNSIVNGLQTIDVALDKDGKPAVQYVSGSDIISTKESLKNPTKVGNEHELINKTIANIVRLSSKDRLSVSEKVTLAAAKFYRWRKGSGFLEERFKGKYLYDLGLPDTNSATPEQKQEAEKYAMNMLAHLDLKIKMGAFFTAHSGIESEIASMTGIRSVAGQWGDMATSKSMMFGIGGLSRAYAVGILGTIGLPIAAAGIGGARAWIREREAYKHKEGQVKGRSVSESVRLREEKKDEIDKLLSDHLALLRDGTTRSADDIAQIRAELEKAMDTAYEKHRGDSYKKGATERNIVSVDVLVDKLEKEIERQNDVEHLGMKKRLILIASVDRKGLISDEEEKRLRHLQELKKSVKAMVEPEKVELLALADKLSQAVSEKAKKKYLTMNKNEHKGLSDLAKEEVVAELGARIDYTKRLINEGRIAFGTPSEQMFAKTRLLCVLGEAMAQVSEPNEEIREEIGKRLGKVLDREGSKVSKARRSKSTKTVLVGAVTGAVASIAGRAVAGYLIEHNVLGLGDASKLLQGGGDREEMISDARAKVVGELQSHRNPEFDALNDVEKAKVLDHINRATNDFKSGNTELSPEEVERRLRIMSRSMIKYSFGHEDVGARHGVSIPTATPLAEVQPALAEVPPTNESTAVAPAVEVMNKGASARQIAEGGSVWRTARSLVDKETFAKAWMSKDSVAIDASGNKIPIANADFVTPGAVVEFKPDGAGGGHFEVGIPKSVEGVVIGDTQALHDAQMKGGGEPSEYVKTKLGLGSEAQRHANMDFNAKLDNTLSGNAGYNALDPDSRESVREELWSNREAINHPEDVDALISQVKHASEELEINSMGPPAPSEMPAPVGDTGDGAIEGTVVDETTTAGAEVLAEELNEKIARKMIDYSKQIFPEESTSLFSLTKFNRLEGILQDKPISELLEDVDDFNTQMQRHGSPELFDRVRGLIQTHLISPKNYGTFVGSMKFSEFLNHISKLDSGANIPPEVSGRLKAVMASK